MFWAADNAPNEEIFTNQEKEILPDPMTCNSLILLNIFIYLLFQKLNEETVQVTFVIKHM